VFIGYRGSLYRFQLSATSSSNINPSWRRAADEGTAHALHRRPPSTHRELGRGRLFLWFFHFLSRFLARSYPFRRACLFFCSQGILDLCFRPGKAAPQLRTWLGAFARSPSTSGLPSWRNEN